MACALMTVLSAEKILFWHKYDVAYMQRKPNNLTSNVTAYLTVSVMETREYNLNVPLRVFFDTCFNEST